MELGSGSLFCESSLLNLVWGNPLPGAVPSPTPCLSLHTSGDGELSRMQQLAPSKTLKMYYEIFKVSQIFKKSLINISLIIKYVIQLKV